jgi:hypothetical protein
MVEIGAIDLSVARAYRFSLCDLPREQLILGLAIPVPERSDQLRDPVSFVKSSDVGTVSIGLRAVDPEGRQLYAHQGRLKDRWIWSFGATSPDGASFVYWLGPDAMPVEARDYELLLTVEPGSLQDISATAQIMATGGGWK